MELFSVILGIVAVTELTYLVYRNIHPLKTRSSFSRPVFVDTSALMDGRIVTAATTGFIPPKLVIPRSVVAELQLLADAADHEKRSRARRGLDAIQELKDVKHITVEILQDGALGEGGVDTRLLELAKKYKGSVCTIDYNLNKVGQVEGVFILNINDLAGNIRMAFLPGEKVSLKLTQKGNDSHQGVGYLNDGTMVVVEQASKDIGSTVEVEFIRSLQTAAGRMMFAKKVAGTTQKVAKTERLKQQQKPNGRRSTRVHKKPKTHEENLVDLANR